MESIALIDLHKNVWKAKLLNSPDAPRCSQLNSFLQVDLPIVGAVSLPAKRLADVETLKPAVARRSEDHVLQVKRILLVDDFEPWRQWVRGRLSNTRFQIVVEATDALDALLQVKQWKPEMILLDIGLPGPNGIETAKRIRQMDRSCKIIFLTENRDPRVMTEALDTGATAYLLKMRLPLS